MGKTAELESSVTVVVKVFKIVVVVVESSLVVLISFIVGF